MTPSLLLTARTASTSGNLLVNPAQADVLRAAGVHTAADVLALPEEIISGHPDRQVSRVRLGNVVAYLKKEHRVPWIERLRNLWAGFGLASKSGREATTLRQVGAVLAGVPTWIAAGETPDGRAFLLLRELTGTRPLSEVLEELHGSPQTRHRLARQLGATLAGLHNSGFLHGDLFAPHVHVDMATLQVFLLDWQRACRTSQHCWRDLAALDVTLSSTLADRHDRLVCLVSYLRHREGRGALREALQGVRSAAARLVGRRHVRAKALRVDEAERPRLLCVRGDALRVTPAFLQLWPHELPAFLDRDAAEDCDVTLPGGGRGRLVCRRHALPWHQRRGAARRTWTSPERVRMNLLFRLRGFGIVAPDVLAAGEKPLADGRVEAFLLTRLLPDAIPLLNWLTVHTDPGPRCCVLRMTGALMARLHEAGCRCSGAEALAVQSSPGKALRVVVVDADRVSRRRWGRLGRWWDLRRLRRSLALDDPAEHVALHEGYRVASGTEENET